MGVRLAARTAATDVLQAELNRREAMRLRESRRLFGHDGAAIPGTWMSREEQWHLLLDAYDEALANDGEPNR